ncbi:hypothetical protein BOX15_Mlig010203g1 [Macrostomum lignano]|uniref:C-type lectin domain-containing protein n=2 Tax=Macrostomum lignano TaxID=282301 RepID=A0A267GQ48_9PLAT|nr:hypothetical protein BOX15_Mlig010203g1 [Macrostomum lignano]
MSNRIEAPQTAGPRRLLLLLLASLLAVAVGASKPAATGGASTERAAFFELCSQGSEWVRFGDYCYWWSGNRSEYWEPAERRCVDQFNGHLASVTSMFEDSFIAKLTYCRSTWLGYYAVNLDLLDQPSNYRWTDRSILTNFVPPHNFSRIPDIHYPLVSAENLQWINRVYHDRHPYVCKVKTPERNRTCDCPNGWQQLNGYCYTMPRFEATYIEADFYCRGRNAFVASLHNNQELRAMSLLDIESRGCPFDTWIGLLKLNPCRVDFSTGKKICYRWSDRSSDYQDFPAWQTGSPSDDQVTNCVLLQDEEIKTVPCHTRARFVCKKKVQLAMRGRQCPAS